ncbi:MAG: PorV/PorQ family protein [candidate division KSB1 bacterium]|nr:PorV/PorQ family protein [candidate division KSB1 bacterium]MDZ7302867.1 PorV/PorQ family protein [candidate division KSB1 bacterium]MDZ7310442.1 PorV/PorQ family protein [candidate division KSB1 bacterium]
MNKFFSYMKAVAVFILCVTAMSEAQPRKKLGQAGLEFLSVISDARAGAMANAMTSLEFQSSALFFNPAGMANMNGFLDVSASNNQWIADITHNAYSLALRPAGGTYGVFGITIQTVDYGEIMWTKVADTPIGYEDTESSIDASAFVIGVGYAKALTDRFSVGGQVKWMRQTLGESLVPGADNTITSVKNEVTPIAFDFGTLFKTGVKSLAFGMSVRNFSKEIKYQQEGFQLPLLFTLGISMDLMDVLGESNLSRSLILSVDATHPRSHPEQLCFALEYKPLEIISLRSGYIANNDEDGPAFGFGISKFGLQLDYAFTPFGVFDNVQRLTARFSY